MKEPHIIYCDNHLLVINKAAGLLVQGDRSGDISLLHMAKAYIKEKFGKPGNVYLGLVHRLDRPVSGVVVFARTSKAAARLSQQFKKRSVRKLYHALAEGKVPEKASWQDNIVRDGVTSRIGADNEGLPASLSFRRLACDNGISLVEIDLGTGRHHQIRVQFASRGFPLVGDFRYGSRTRFGDKAVALHARAITLMHPTRKEEMTFTAEYPESWREFL